MTGTIKTTSVQGTEYKVWSDFIKRVTFAVNTVTGEKKIISESYLKNDLSIRKAIAITFKQESFRK